MTSKDKPGGPRNTGTPEKGAPGPRTDETAPTSTNPKALDQDEWRLGGSDFGLERDYEGAGTDPNYRGGSFVDQRGTRRAEPYARSGPSGGRQPDEAIQEDARRRLTSSPGLDAREVEVNVSRGEVTLKGWVPDGGQKLAAGDLVDAVPGVLEVHNLLKARS